MPCFLTRRSLPIICIAKSNSETFQHRDCGFRILSRTFQGVTLAIEPKNVSCFASSQTGGSYFISQDYSNVKGETRCESVSTLDLHTAALSKRLAETDQRIPGLADGPSSFQAFHHIWVEFVWLGNDDTLALSKRNENLIKCQTSL